MAKAGSTPFDEPPITAPVKPKGKIVDDPELIAMNRINRIINALPNEPTRIRVIRWLAAKAEFPLTDS